MHLLREELSYQVTPAMLKEAGPWFAKEGSVSAAIDSHVVTGQDGQQGDEANPESAQRVAESVCECLQCGATRPTPTPFVQTLTVRCDDYTSRQTAFMP